MSTTTMHFGPEWMRTKHQPLPRSQHPPSPPPANGTHPGVGLTTLLSGNSTKDDGTHPFRYSKEELVRIYQEGGGKGPLGQDVERWEGVVRSVGADPITMREMSEAEKKLFTGPLNSEVRRRPSQSAEYLSPLATSNLGVSRLNQSPSGSASSPMRERFGGLKRRDSGSHATDPGLLGLPRKPSLSTLQSPGHRDPTTRTRVGYSGGFEGVLSNGEAWSARRRTTDSVSKFEAVSERDVDGGHANEKRLGLREGGDSEPSKSSPTSDDELALSASMSSLLGSSDAKSSVSDAGRNGVRSPTNDLATGQTGIGAPPGLSDLSAVEWSYKDPQGQVQGPFRADIMQRWFNEGYFSLDLPMRRTHIDTDWTTVEDLIKRANGANVFLSPLAPSRSYVNESPASHPHPVEQQFTGPYHPSPVRSLRPSTLDYLNGGPDSPASSFAASVGNHSPDPHTFVSREPGGPSRLANMQGPGFGNYVVENTPNQYARDPWLTNTAFPVSRDPAPYHAHPGLEGMGHHGQLYASPSAGTQQMAGLFQPGYSYDAHGNGYINHNVGVDGFDSFGGVHGGRGYVPAPDHGQQAYFGYRGLQQNEALAGHGSAHLSGAGHIPVQSPWSGISEPQQQHQHHPVSSDVAHPIEQPHIVAHTLPQSPWGVVEDSTVKASATETIPTDPTVHAAKSKDEVTPPVEATPEVPTPAPVEVVAETLSDLSIVSTEDAPPAVIPRRQSPVQSAPEPVVQPAAAPKAAKIAKSVEQPSPAPSRPAEPVTPSPAPKSAWAVEEETNKATTISLREIQEAEAKKAEAKKLLERERERLNRAPSGSESKEDVQPFTASWGLPTSQAGRNVHSTKDSSPVSSSPTSTTPVWSAPAKQTVVKKSMKEILEEEEKRKKLALAKEQAAAAPVKRAYAETTTKSVPVGTPGSAWTTVGPSGKSSSPAPTPAPAARPPTTSLPSFSAAAASSTRVTSAAAPRGAVVSKPRAAAEAPYTPSHDFLKWMSDSLKGLNTSVNVEEIVSMLLSFPMDPDQTTMEIISDTIYSNSTTLDGRRFAAEFVAKRKTDAASRAQTAAAKGAAKPVSIADVVKATPKVAQPEWGFKVVNKKKKGGKA